MRHLIPKPCSGPSTSSVFSTISASVPCGTSVFSFMDYWVTHRKYDTLLLGKQQVKYPTDQNVGQGFGPAADLPVGADPRSNAGSFSALPPSTRASTPAARKCTAAGTQSKAPK